MYSTRSEVPSISKREWALVTAALLVLGALALRPSIRGNDGVGHFIYLASLLGDGNLDFTDDYLAFDNARQYSFHFSDLPRDPSTGLPSNRYGVGAAFLWLPFVGTVHLARLTSGSPIGDLTGESYAWAVGLATLFWGTLGLVLLYARLRLDCHPWAAAWTLAGLVLATPLGFYLYAHGSMSHGVSFFACVVMLLVFERAWDRPDGALLLGAGVAAGLTTIIRFQDATWSMLVVGLLAGRLLWRRSGVSQTQRWQGLAALTAGGLAVLLPQMAVWRVLYGSWFSGPTPYLSGSAGELSLLPSHLAAVLLSERGGVLAWHPLIALGLVGLALLWRSRSRRSAAALGLLGFAASLWLVASWSMWWAGASFGNRFFISSLPWIALGVGRWLEGPATAVGGRTRWRPTVIGLLIVWNLGLLVQYATEMVPREEAIPWTRVIRQNLIDVPSEVLKRVLP